MIALAGAVAGTAVATTAVAGIRFAHTQLPGEPYVELKGVVQNAVIGPFSVANVFRAIESDKTVKIRNLAINGVTASMLQRDGIRIRGDAAGINIRNFRLAMRATPQSGRNLPIGIAVQEGQDISIADGSISGFRMIAVPGEYTNGDGIAAERPVTGLSIARVRAFDNSDGGFDLKSSATTLDQLVAERNGRNYRFWRTVQAGRLTSVDPRNAHIWLARGAQVRINQLSATSRSTAPLIRVEGPASIVVASCQLRLPAGTRLVAGNTLGSDIRLGRGCTTRGGRPLATLFSLVDGGSR
jgi:hypothetical protein